MNKHYFFIIAFIFVALSMQLTSCKKPLLFSKGNLSFSRDTVVFDTVFTTIGSTTKQFKFYNNDNRAVQVEQIELMGGSNSPYRINVDGVSGIVFSDINIEGNDSLFVFVEVTLDPNSGLLPMVVEDSIRFRTNGVDQYVQLAAWGQDAYFHYSDFSIPNGAGLDINSGVWPNDKPHVILNTAFIDSATTLTIQQGTDIYLHKGAILYNYKGTLNIEGSKDFPVTLQGDRLEAAYDDVSGQYYGIYMQEARESSIDYAYIKNGISGIHIFDNDPSNSNYTLNLSNTVIENCARYGLFIYSGGKLHAENCIVNRNGTHGMLVLEGGSFNLNHCTIVGYAGGDESSAAIGISNYFVDQINAVTNVGSINEGTITNSVIYGNLEHELAIDTISDIAITLNFDIQNNLIRSETVFSAPFYQNNIWNSDPEFFNASNGDYHWTITSPLNANANSAFTGTMVNPSTAGFDIHGTMRDGATPDIGAFEKL